MILCLITLGIIAVASALLVAFSKRVTIPAGFVIIALLSVLMYLSCRDVSLFFMAVPVLAMIGWGYFSFEYKELDFSNRILSISPNLNKHKDGRIIGKCFPYYDKQLKYNNSTIVQNNLSLNGGTIITGSSGSGKTHAIIEMIKQDVAQGKSVAFYNFKGDKDTTEEVANSVGNVKVYELSWNECNFSYDPLINLDDAGRAEAILNMRKWSIDGNDAHYKTSTQLFLQRTIKEFNYKGGNYLNEYYKFLRTYNVQREMYDAYNTTIKLLELTITSNVGEIFTGDKEKFKFDTDEQFVLIVSFTSNTKALATSLTSLMLNDLMEVGTRKSYSPSLCLYIDEFGACESSLIVKDILERGRSCGISTVISMQDLNQLIINTNAPFLDSILGTVNSYIIFPGSTKQTAEMMSGTQIYEIDKLLMSLRKPINGKPPTAVYISKYPVFGKGGTEVYRFIPYSSKNIVAMNDKPETVGVKEDVEDVEEVFQDSQEEVVGPTSDVEATFSVEDMKNFL